MFSALKIPLIQSQRFPGPRGGPAATHSFNSCHSWFKNIEFRTPQSEFKCPLFVHSTHSRPFRDKTSRQQTRKYRISKPQPPSPTPTFVHEQLKQRDKTTKTFSKPLPCFLYPLSAFVTAPPRGRIPNWEKQQPTAITYA